MLSWRALWVIGLLTIADTQAQQSSPQQTFRLCTEVYDHPSASKSVSTATQELVTSAGKAANITIEILKHAWNRCLSEVKDKRLDGLFALIWTPERDEFLVFPQGSQDGTNQARLVTASYYYFENRAQPLDLNNLKFGIGAPLGYVVRETLRQQGLLSPIDYNLREGLLMVARAKLDAYLAGGRQAAVVTKALGIEDKIRMRRPAVMQKDLHVAFNKPFFTEHQAAIERFWQQLERLRPEAERRFGQ